MFKRKMKPFLVVFKAGDVVAVIEADQFLFLMQDAVDALGDVLVAEVERLSILKDITRREVAGCQLPIAYQRRADVAVGAEFTLAGP